MNSCDERRIGKTTVTERQEIELIVNEVELIRPFEYL